MQGKTFGAIHSDKFFWYEAYFSIFFSGTDSADQEQMLFCRQSSGDPDQMPHSVQNVASDQGLHCLVYIMFHWNLNKTEKNTT